MPPCPSTFPLFPPSEHLNTIYLSRHGESLNNLYGRIGGDKGLSERGQKYAKELSKFVNSLKLPGLKVRLLNKKWSQLNHLNISGLDNSIPPHKTNCWTYWSTQTYQGSPGRDLCWISWWYDLWRNCCKVSCRVCSERCWQAVLQIPSWRELSGCGPQD